MASTDPNNLSLLTMLLLISIPGAFGGFTAGLFDINKAKSKNAAFCSLTCRTLIGVAGAFGVILVGFWVGKIDTKPDVLNQLFLISFSLIGGTISYRVLPKIGSKLEEQLQLQMDETKDKVQEVVENTNTKLIEAKAYSAAMASADGALATEKTADLKLAIEMMLTVKPSNRFDRTLHVKIGRCYRKLKQYNDAIVVLSKFITALKKEKASGVVLPHCEQNIADAYFNIACYYTLKAEEVSETLDNDEDMQRLVNKAIESLKISIDIIPDNRAVAIGDKDFDFIRNNKQFKKVVEN